MLQSPHDFFRGYTYRQLLRALAKELSHRDDFTDYYVRLIHAEMGVRERPNTADECITRGGCGIHRTEE